MLQEEGTPAEGILTGVSDLSLRPASDWKSTLESVIKAVVSIHFGHVDGFDTQKASCGQATGFVVDKENGYILTNRHVVGSGRFWGYCTFSSHEEVGTLGFRCN